jgi:NADPH-dependent curcumin reductase CurA
MEKLILKIVEAALRQMSPEFRSQICGLVSNLEAQAKATKNPWDDILVSILKIALDIP